MLNLTTLKTPGVYIDEVPKFPPSIAAVETAIPAFVGYTQKAERRGEDLTNRPTRIGSLLEFTEYFGGDKSPVSINVEVDDKNNYAVKRVKFGDADRFYMYDSLRHFYDNGGGNCYVVSVGNFGAKPAPGDENDVNSKGLRVGVKSLEKVDEPTIILCPDAIRMDTSGNDDPGFYSLQQMILAQCAKLQDRVGVFDLKENIDAGFDSAVENFRNNIGINNLKYGIAYAPRVRATFAREVDFEVFRQNVFTKLGDNSTKVDLLAVSTDATLNALVANAINAGAEAAKVESVITKIRKASNAGVLGASTNTAPSMKDKFKDLKQKVDESTTEPTAKNTLTNLISFCRNSLLEFVNLKLDFTTINIKNDLDSYATSESMWRGDAKSLILIDRNQDTLALTAVADVNALYATADLAWLGVAAITDIVLPVPAKDYGDETVAANLPAIARLIAKDLESGFDKLDAFAATLISAAKNYKKSAQEALYERHPVIGNIANSIKNDWNTLPVSGAIAGVYARVDNSRGVWKAPANETLNSVSMPSVSISHDEQANLNVDVNAGKSINVIRSFIGKGTLIWGARTLAGNDNEWRYVSVRRFFNMAEESIKKATEQFVFEPNDANTWVKVQAMIENFLNTLWRVGALQGAKPEHAYYVAVGLGKTMTPLDILEGRMIVEIGMAVVRPAEFIILRFSHKLAES